jgi:hypothetical protein
VRQSISQSTASILIQSDDGGRAFETIHMVRESRANYLEERVLWLPTRCFVTGER